MSGHRGRDSVPIDEIESRALRAVAARRATGSRSSAATSCGSSRLLGGGLLVASVADARRAAGVRARRSAGVPSDLRRGSTSTGTGGSPRTPARPRSDRTSGRRSRRRSPTSCGCRSATSRSLMADTDLVPFDQGTFGSQSTPRMAPVLARAAATAREMLIDRAAAHLERGSRGACRARTDASARPGPCDRLRRSRQGPEARGDRSPPMRRCRHPAQWTAPRHGRKEGRRPGLRDRRAIATRPTSRGPGCCTAG